MVRNWASVTSAAHAIGPAAILARDCVSFVMPVIRKTVANSPWAIKSTASMVTPRRLRRRSRGRGSPESVGERGSRVLS